MGEFFNHNKGSEIHEAALVLVNGLADNVMDIPEEGLEQLIWYEFDASRIFGSGWSFTLSVKWQSAFNCYWLELAAYKASCPYKCSTLLFTGSKKELLDSISHSDIELYEKIEQSIPRLKNNLEDV